MSVLRFDREPTPAERRAMQLVLEREAQDRAALLNVVLHDPMPFFVEGNAAPARGPVRSWGGLFEAGL